MMNDRTCPKCNAKLGSYDNYFCSECGTELPLDQQRQGASIVQVLTLESSEEKHNDTKGFVLPVLKKVAHIVNLKELLFIGILVLVVGIPSFVWLSNLNSFVPEKPKNQVAQKPKMVSLLKVTDNFDSYVFGSNFVYEYIPADVDIFIEANDFSEFIRLFSMYDSGYEELLTALASIVDSHFAAYLKSYNGEYVWTLIVFPYGDISNEESSAFFQKFWWLKFYIQDKALVISTKDVSEEVKAAKNKTIKNLELNPKFASVKNELARNGKILVVTLTDNGKNYIENLVNSDKKIPTEFKPVLEMYNKSTYKNIVFN